jgi:molybdopterin synthase catalytic subunit
MKIDIRNAPFNPWNEIQDYQEQMQKAGQFGAMACFIGSMRDFNEDEKVMELQLEHYPGMTEKHLIEICDEAGRKWELIDVLVMHRTGKIKTGDPIVIVCVWSEHRAAAFDACRFIMEDLKSKAPFWKQETLEHGKRWVEKNTPG